MAKSNIIIIIVPGEFFSPVVADGLSLEYVTTRLPQVSKTLLRILADYYFYYYYYYYLFLESFSHQF